MDPNDLPMIILDHLEEDRIQLPLMREIEPHHPLLMERVIENAILNALAWTDGNIKQAAIELGIARETIYRRLKGMGFLVGPSPSEKES